MAPEERKRYVRGILCFACNTALRHRVTLAWLLKATDYMTKYAQKTY